jgi:ubiquinone/menaquinone biosynthesis C-methylase UbiE
MSDSPEAQKEQVRALFSGLASEYDAHGGFAHFGRRLVDIAGVEPGQRVLDVASGRGAVLFPAAERVGVEGQVEGIDLAEGMVQATNVEAERRGVAARVRVMDAEHLDFPDASFDRVLCGFGIMFFPDQLRGLAEFRRVLRPGGQVGVSTSRVAEIQPLAAIINAMGLGRAAPPGWITDPDILAQLLRRAGFADVQVMADTHVFHRADLEAYWQAARGGGFRETVDALDAAQAERIRAMLAERLSQYQEPDGYHVPATALLGIARRE